jgi:hypothetical protein
VYKIRAFARYANDCYEAVYLGHDEMLLNVSVCAIVLLYLAHVFAHVQLARKESGPAELRKEIADLYKDRDEAENELVGEESDRFYSSQEYARAKFGPEIDKFKKDILKFPDVICDFCQRRKRKVGNEYRIMERVGRSEIFAGRRRSRVRRCHCVD